MKKVFSIMHTLTIIATSTLALAAADVVRYSDFGAKGDGKTDDMPAIVKAHEYANKHNLPVKADDNATYLIGNTPTTAIIQTDTDFGKAHFIIDDRKLEKTNQAIFSVFSTIPSHKIEGLSTLKRNQANLGITLPRKSLVVLYNKYVKRYIRYGGNQNNGSQQVDVILVDADGSIDPNAPLIWDFDHITDATAFPLEQKLLTVSGGIFTTIANQEASRYNYYSRNIVIKRSNTLVTGLKHLVTGEGDTGAPYSGFLDVNRAANVTIRDCILTGHKTYRTIGSAGVTVSMGTYDLGANTAVNISFIGLTQSNDIRDGSRWGIIGTNYCKNILFENCTLSRFDAHCGVANATIRNSTMGHAGINTIGCGTFTLDNVTSYGRSLISLRADYGSTWEGDFVIRNCTLIPACGRRTNPVIISGYNSGQHDFGYVCHFPAKVTIDGLLIKDAKHNDKYDGPAIIGNFNANFKDNSYQEKFPMRRSTQLRLHNIRTESGLNPIPVANPVMFNDVKVTILP